MTPTPLTENPAELSKIRCHYPCCDSTKSLDDIFSHIVQAGKGRLITHLEKLEKLQAPVYPDSKWGIRTRPLPPP